MTLYDICKMIAQVEDGLAYGEITFSYDNLMCAMKPGHPADLLDDILALIGWDVYAGKNPSSETVREVLKQLKAFKETFEVQELVEPIKALEVYVAAWGSE